MDIAALVLWLITAVGGFGLLSLWLANGGVTQLQAGTTRFSPILIFGHPILAATGLVVFIIYLISDESVFAWLAFVLLIPVALLGFTMFARWLGGRSAPATAASTGNSPAEQGLPVALVFGHGLLAVVTVILVFLAALDAG